MASANAAGNSTAPAAREPGAGEPAVDAVEEGADAVDGRLGLGERVGRVVERRPVVRGAEQVAHGERRREGA